MNELEPLLRNSPGHISRLTADKAYDSGPLRDDLTARGIEPVIPARSNWVNPPPHDAQVYKARHIVENSFADIKQYRGIATRYHKLKVTFTAMVQLCWWHLATKPKRRKRSPHLTDSLDSSGTSPDPKPPKVRPRQGRLPMRT